MTLRLIIVACCLTGPIAAQEKSCVGLESDHILGKDLARALPEFSAIPPEAVVTPAPLAGATRVFRAEETAALASRFSIKLTSPKETCFEWEMGKLNRSVALEAMRKSLGLADARIEITETISDRAPRGPIDFPREGLGKPASPDQPSPVLWRGNITYGGGRRFAIWARVRIVVPVNVITATETLKPGQPIRAEQLKTVARDRFPGPVDSTLTIQQVAGMLPLRSIFSGGEVSPGNLVRPNDVNRGDLVAIEVRSGSTRLTFSGRAESAGHTGDMIAVRNPESNKIFRARVSARNKAIVEPPPGWEN